MNDNVIDFPGGTTVDIPAEKILKAAIEADLGDCVVMGGRKTVTNTSPAPLLTFGLCNSSQIG